MHDATARILARTQQLLAAGEDADADVTDAQAERIAAILHGHGTRRPAPARRALAAIS